LRSAAQLAPGQSADFTFTYSLSVQDDGLAAPFDAQANGCIAIFPTPCGPTYAGFEYAKAFLVVAHEDPRTTHNPAWCWKASGRPPCWRRTATRSPKR
jgi:hypothetical protein